MELTRSNEPAYQNDFEFPEENPKVSQSLR